MSNAPQDGPGENGEVVHEAGPWPFVTKRHYLREGRVDVWRSRDQRRGLKRAIRAGSAGDWRPETLNAPIGWGFAVGSSLFMVGAVLALEPQIAADLSLSSFQVNAVFFVGSIFFTLAAYLQVFQAANSAQTVPKASRGSPRKWSVIGWLPTEIGWLSSMFQFIGTLLFNISTFMAVSASGGWLRQDLTIWVPDVFGSILFLVSACLAFMETSHGYWSFRPARISWWVVTVNLAGCVAFMVSAIYAFVPRTGASAEMTDLSVTWTLYGATGFLVGAGLMLIEGTRQSRPA